MSDLTNKTVVITGASRGIGAAAARHLASLGASVVLAARSTGDIERIAKEIEAAGGTATAMACDVARNEDVKALVARTVELYGGLDVLVNNAGLIDPIARIADSDPDAWSQVVDVNVKGVYYGLRHAIPEMTARGGGTIINISSGAATGALEGWSHYCATKAAVAIKASGLNPVSQLDPSVHIPAEWVAQTIAYLCGPGGDAYLGTDFSLKTNEGRAAVGLPPVS
eukprot:jgi/Tetstr1/446384/TSEL_033926.t1